MPSSVRRLLIASAKGGVGKSTTAVGIAAEISRMGKKTLLCDLDMTSRSLDMLTARIDLAKEAIPLGRVYHTDKLEVVREKDGYVLVKIPTELDGKECDVQLKLIETADGWRLDNPTY